MARKDLTGQVFHYLTVIGDAPNHRTKSGVKRCLFVRCKCGTEKIVQYGHLTNKRHPQRSCGCYRHSKEFSDKISNAQKSYRHSRNPDTPFFSILKAVVRRRSDCDLTLDYLKTLWENQNGKCVYSGVSLRLPQHTGDIVRPLYLRASLDRIDSDKSYIQGNVQFVSTTINYAKHDMTHNEMLEFIELLKQSG